MSAGLIGEESLQHFRALPISEDRYRSSNDAKALWRADELTYDLATSDKLTEILDLLFEGAGYHLWGAQLVDRPPGFVHPWHTDIETAKEGFVSLWIGIGGTDEQTSPVLIEGSHQFPHPVQAYWPSGHPARTDPTGSEILAHPVVPQGTGRVVAVCKDGDGLFFDGRLWHGTFNRGAGPRRALLLQYGRHEVPVRTPTSLTAYPFEFDTAQFPLTTPVRGTPDPVVNKTVQRRPEGGFAYPIAEICARPELKADEDRSWTMHPYFQVETPLMSRFSCHASVLSPGYMPHTPHQHGDEELLIVLSGRAAVFAAADRSGALRMVQAGPGDVFYYPRGLPHTISNLSSDEEELRYVMFRWTAKTGRSEHVPGFVVPALAHRGNKRLWIDRPSSGLDKIHIHSTRLAPGQALERHTDRYDTAILVLSGELSVLHQTLGSGGVFLTRAGELHDTRNIGDRPCSYLVFEFHAMAN